MFKQLHPIRYFYLIIFFAFALSSTAIAQQITMLPQDKQEDVDRYLELVDRYKKANNLQQAIFYLNRVAIVYWENGGLREAVTYFLESVPLNEKVGNYTDIKAIYSNIGLIYTDLERFDLALENFYKSLEARRRLNDKSEIAAGLIDVAYIHGALRQHEKAIPLLEEALELSRDLGNSRLTFNCLSLLSFNYDQVGNLAKAQETNSMLAQIKQLLARQEVAEEYEEIVGRTEAEVQRERAQRTAQELEMELQRLKAQATRDSLGFVVQAKQDSLKQAEQISRQRAQEIEILESQREIQRLAQSELEAKQRAQQTIIISGAGGLLLFILLSLFIYRGYRDKRKANTLLSHQNEEIQKQRDQIQKQNENISKSINYAQGIQKALLPSQKNLEQYFSDSFIYFKPRDVVSGDYYWFKPIPGENGEFNLKTDKVAISAIDCTGHGVPGAFLSMIGYNLLDEIIDKGVHKPGRILQELNRGIRKALRQDETDNRDGMDMALCVWDPQKKTIEFSGAKNPLVYICNGELTRIRGDKESIGGGTNYDQEFTTHEIPVDATTWVYMFSDGFIDQFGGNDGRKFMIKKFTELLQHIHELPASEQHEILKITFNEWKRQEFPQVDDVLVMGFKLEV
ncbi:MAG TPA: tetratricopeptide repeat protein [Bacteroidetes bacterium]|nr:tetratricopeptide repeat protein [Bacteroidota bacterium]